jgi:ComF family protein
MVACGRGIAESLFATLFPSDCRLCGTPLTNISRLPVCEECLVRITPVRAEVCDLCGELLPDTNLFGTAEQPGPLRTCGLCKRVPPPFAKAAAYGSYDGGLRELVHLLKYEGVRPASHVLGRMLSEVMAEVEAMLSGSVLVIPVPLHARKLRQRGFNQSELIARAALKLRKRPQMVLAPELLIRRRETQSQIGLTSHQRRENIRGAFAASEPARLEGKNILLVDDVFTTGTTASECARILKKAGASNVIVATVARTFRHDVQGIQALSEDTRVLAVHA